MILVLRSAVCMLYLYIFAVEGKFDDVQNAEDASEDIDSESCKLVGIYVSYIITQEGVHLIFLIVAKHFVNSIYMDVAS